MAHAHCVLDKKATDTRSEYPMLVAFLHGKMVTRMRLNVTFIHTFRAWFPLTLTAFLHLSTASVKAVTAFRHGLLLSNRGSNRFSKKMFIDSLKRPDRLWGPPTFFLAGLGLRNVWLTTDLSVVPKLRTRRLVLPLH
jgi:hypothetical protein